MTAASTMPCSTTSVQMVELSRDFILPPRSFSPCRQRSTDDADTKLNTWSGKSFQQPAQVDHQCEPVIVPQHTDAMRNIFRRLFQHLFAVHRISADHLVGGYSDTKNFVLTVRRQRCNHHVTRQESRPPPFGHSDVDQWH